MRNISILALVLFLSISANAAVNIVFNGVANPLETPVLDPLQTADIDVVTDGALTSPAYFVLGIMQGEPGSLDNGIVWPQDPHILIYPPDPEPPFPGLGSWIMFSYDGFSPIPPSIILNDAIFHCDGPGNVYLQLWETQDFAEWMLNDTQMIIQTPEPATIALLGIGAMLLKRRK